MASFPPLARGQIQMFYNKLCQQRGEVASAGIYSDLNQTIRTRSVRSIRLHRQQIHQARETFFKVRGESELSSFRRCRGEPSARIMGPAS